MDGFVSADHRARYKNSGRDPSELRRRREKDSFQLRKQKREDVLSKRRTIGPSSSPPQELLANSDELIEQTEILDITDDVVKALMQNQDQELILENAQKVRKILSKEPQPPFDDVIEKGLVSRFVELLDCDHTQIQFEVAWILTNICSGTSEQTRAVVDHGAVPKLVGLLNSTDMKVCEQAVWALGNIIGDGAYFRDLVIGYNFVPALLALIKPDLDIGFLRNETWVLVNLCRNKDPPPSIEVIGQLIPALSYLIQLTDLAILIDTTWAISYITELGPTFSQLILDSGLVVKMTPLLSHKEIKIQTAAIRALGSIVTGNEDQTQAVIDAGALPHLKSILRAKRERLSKEALWFISNITAGSPRQIQAIIDENLICEIINYLDNGDANEQKEAVWSVYNMTLSGSVKQIELLVEKNIIACLCKCLAQKDNQVIRNVLESLNTILSNLPERKPDICDMIEECGGLDQLEQLQSSENVEVYHLAYSIIDSYFSTDN